MPVVRILRRYPRRGTTYQVGDLCEVPQHALPGVLGAKPPYGELVEDLDRATAPKGPEPDTDAEEPKED